jgi:leucyl/phenylalanyl-tRNA--protein transferase
MRGFTTDDLIACYRRGVFPMAEDREDDRIFLVDPDLRGIIPLDGFHLSRRLRRTLLAGGMEVRIDTAFSDVVRECARPRPSAEQTWISRPIQSMYEELFRRGVTHSVECWSDDQLVGGLYGVSIGAAFFGESMFSRVRDASKVALAHLVARLTTGGYDLLDTQFMTEHLAQFGALEIPRADYQKRLARALEREGDFARLDPATQLPAILQAINQAS